MDKRYFKVDDNTTVKIGDRIVAESDSTGIVEGELLFDRNYKALVVKLCDGMIYKLSMFDEFRVI